MSDNFDLDAFLKELDIELDSTAVSEEPVVTRTERRRRAEETETSAAKVNEPVRARRTAAETPAPAARNTAAPKKPAVDTEPRLKNTDAEVSSEPRRTAVGEVPYVEGVFEPAPKKVERRPVTPDYYAQEKKRSRKLGNRFLPIYTILFAALILGALVYLWIHLGHYEERVQAEAAETARQEALVAEEAAHREAVREAPQLAFEAWRDSCDAVYWTDLWYGQNPEDMNGRDRVQDYLGTLFAPENLQSFRSLDYTDEAPVYVLKSGEDTVARAALTGSDVNWQVSDVQLLLKGDKSATIRVASGAKVYCNGEMLDKSFISDSTSTFDCEVLADQLVNPVTWDTYTVSGLLIEPELTADPPAGYRVAETAEGDFLLCLDDAASANYITTSVNFVQKYYYYYLCGGTGLYDNYAVALSFLTPDTPAYQNLKDSLDGVYWNGFHSNIDSTNVTADSVQIWADNCYSVDVTYSISGMVNTGDIETFDGVMRIYWMGEEGNFHIVHFETL